jgi:hypothetical protein
MSSEARVPLAALLASVLAAAIVTAAGPVFYPDDPLQVDRDTAMDASAVQPTRVVGLKDLVSNTLRDTGDRRDVPAANVNTIGEVPDSSWFTNRLRSMAPDVGAIVKGPDRMMSLSIDGWPIVEGKGEGLQPGFRVRDPDGHLYQIKLDPVHRPEMSTAAEVIGTAFFHALGYNVADVYLVEFDPARTVIAEEAVIRDGGGRERRLVKRDIEDVLTAAARLPDGKYRALASRFIDGLSLGGFRYHGTRADDPNDVIPHEHRRELRALRVFAAWLNHDEAAATNTLDALVDGEGGRRFVKHYLLDFGSLLGSDTTRAQRGRGGNEYLLEWGPGLRTAATFGLLPRPWLLVDYPDVPRSVGRFESAFFDPARWRPVYPNPAFENMRPEDAFWAARVLARLSPEAIAAVVAKARYSDPAATAYVTKTLVERREKVLRTWLTGVNPVVDVRLAADGRLSFSNAAVEAGVGTAPASYRLAWFALDNATGQRTPLGEPSSITSPEGVLPPLTTSPTFVGVDISAGHADHSSWSHPVTAVFRRESAGWSTVGLSRTAPAPHAAPDAPPVRPR